MAFLKERPPTYGVPEIVTDGIVRIVAANPGVMTYHGTNTYIIEQARGFLVLDPGPDDDGHVDAIMNSTRGEVAAILLTHTHADHLGATAALTQRTGALSHAFFKSADPTFSPDVPISDGEHLFGMTAIHTPGHASDHLCYARDDGILFSGDHVMGWSSSVVSPPLGNMALYMASLGLLLDRQEQTYLPGHGPSIFDPTRHVKSLLEHRQNRENEILKLVTQSSRNIADIAVTLYHKRDPRLMRAAERNVLAHMLKLAAEGKVDQTEESWSAIPVTGARPLPVP